MNLDTALERLGPVGAPAACILGLLGMTLYAGLVGSGLVYDHVGGVIVRPVLLAVGCYGSRSGAPWGRLLIWLFAGTLALEAFGQVHQFRGSVGVRVLLLIAGLLSAAACGMLVVDSAARRRVERERPAA